MSGGLMRLVNRPIHASMDGSRLQHVVLHPSHGFVAAINGTTFFSALERRNACCFQNGPPARTVRRLDVHGRAAPPVDAEDDRVDNDDDGCVGRIFGELGIQTSTGGSLVRAAYSEGLSGCLHFGGTPQSGGPLAVRGATNSWPR